MPKGKNIRSLVVVGVSAGGMQQLICMLHVLPAEFTLPMVCVLHLSESIGDSCVRLLNTSASVIVKAAEENEHLANGAVYIAPPGHHLLIKADRRFTLSEDEKVNYARPSIDVFFISAAQALGEQVIGFLGTGGNKDGALGLKAISEKGGYTMVQDPSTAEFPFMPESALHLFEPNAVVSQEKLIEQLLKFDKEYKCDL